MSKQKFYLYYPELVPETMPEECQNYTVCEKWQDVKGTDWSKRYVRRWPVPEYVYRTYHFCMAHGISVKWTDRLIIELYPDCEVVGFAEDRCYGDGTFTINHDGHTCDVYYYCPILKPIEQWITPTDEDAKERRKVQVRDHDEEEWQDATLLAVFKTCVLCLWPYGGKDYMTFRQCRMKKENKQ